MSNTTTLDNKHSLPTTIAVGFECSILFHLFWGCYQYRNWVKVSLCVNAFKTQKENNLTQTSKSQASTIQEGVEPFKHIYKPAGLEITPWQPILLISSLFYCPCNIAYHPNKPGNGKLKIGRLFLITHLHTYYT